MSISHTCIWLWFIKEKENTEFKPVKLRLKSDFVSSPARSEGLGNYRNIECLHALADRKQTQTLAYPWLWT